MPDCLYTKPTQKINEKLIGEMGPGGQPRMSVGLYVVFGFMSYRRFEVYCEFHNTLNAGVV